MSDVLMNNIEWNKLPIIVSAPGEYITRDGRQVTVHEIGETATFCVRGSIWVEFRGKLRPRRHEIWHPNGRVSLTVEGRKRDIVGAWTGN